MSNISCTQDPRVHALTQLLPKADKAASGAGGAFSFFGNRTEKYENAADLYQRAANAFRMQKQGTAAPQPRFSERATVTLVTSAETRRSQVKKLV